MNLLSIGDAPGVLKASLKNNRRPVCLLSQPGVGKSFLVNQVAEELNMKLISISTAQKEPTDICGYPVPIGDDVLLKQIGSFKELTETNEPTILFLDEMLQAIPQVQSALMQLIQFRIAGDNKLSDKVKILCASNRPEDLSGVHQMNPALMDRTTPYELYTTLELFTKYWVKKKYDPMILSFLSFRPNMLLYTGKMDAKKIGYYYSPRSIEDCYLWMKTLKDENIEVKINDISAICGQSWATEYVAYMRVFDKLPDINLILNNKINYKITDLAVLYAVTYKLTTLVKKDNVSNIIKFFEIQGQEFLSLFINFLPEDHEVWNDDEFSKKAIELFIK